MMNQCTSLTESEPLRIINHVYLRKEITAEFCTFTSADMVKEQSNKATQGTEEDVIKECSYNPINLIGPNNIAIAVRPPISTIAKVTFHEGTGKDISCSKHSSRGKYHIKG